MLFRSIRLSNFSSLGRPLQYQDLTVLLMLSVESSNGTIVQQQFKDLALYDIVHLVSRKIEKIMKADEIWDAYRQACCACANAVRQSKLGHLKPTKPPTKARRRVDERPNMQAIRERCHSYDQADERSCQSLRSPPLKQRDS